MKTINTNTNTNTKIIAELRREAEAKRELWRAATRGGSTPDGKARWEASRASQLDAAADAAEGKPLFFASFGATLIVDGIHSLDEGTLSGFLRASGSGKARTNGAIRWLDGQRGFLRRGGESKETGRRPWVLTISPRGDVLHVVTGQKMGAVQAPSQLGSAGVSLETTNGGATEHRVGITTARICAEAIRCNSEIAGANKPAFWGEVLAAEAVGLTWSQYTSAKTALTNANRYAAPDDIPALVAAAGPAMDLLRWGAKWAELRAQKETALAEERAARLAAEEARQWAELLAEEAREKASLAARTEFEKTAAACGMTASEFSSLSPKQQALAAHRARLAKKL